MVRAFGPCTLAFSSATTLRVLGGTVVDTVALKQSPRQCLVLGQSFEPYRTLQRPGDVGAMQCKPLQK